MTDEQIDKLFQPLPSRQLNEHQLDALANAMVKKTEYPTEHCGKVWASTWEKYKV